ncbi:MAG TPA: UDP-4-amino-4,6-dideoxy-N-acetyl-beta-L-altrosamine transaminase [Ignavibacteria bacterium]|nr:UDP-4-amino-4,6-dideoxy-N-acetyl-beta-L-altrosamine transaminase [Ignavibacteria bacterium]
MFDSKISYGKQCIDESDINEVVRVLKSDWLTQGPEVSNFENNLCKYFGSTNSVAVSNGTASLHLIAKASGWNVNDVIITSPISFLASINCAIYCGAVPEFADIDSKTYTIDPVKLEEKIFSLKKSGKNVKAVVAVDFAGNVCDWKFLKSLSEKYDFKLVNDFCHALGAEYYNDKQYAVKFAETVNMSFHPVKHITTGEGGAVLTDNTELAEKIKLLRTHGMTKDANLLEENHGSWYYEMIDLGFNYRITDFQCALGSNQLKKLDGYLINRRKIASAYDEAFSNIENITIPFVRPEVKHAYHLYPLLINFEKFNISRKELFEKLSGKNIFCQVHYIPIHLQPYYKNNYGFKKNDFPIAEDFYSKEISLPVYPTLTDSEVNYVIESLKSVLKI